jgi:hypothetical protein
MPPARRGIRLECFSASAPRTRGRQLSAYDYAFVAAQIKYAFDVLALSVKERREQDFAAKAD